MGMADAKLTRVMVAFYTHSDNKDHDTVLNVLVKNKVSMFLSEDLASGENLGGDMEFSDSSTHQFDLALLSTTTTLGDLNVPVVNIHIQPNGHDRWIFDYTLSLYFDNGKTFSSSENGIILDQDNRDHTGVFQG
ncbi:Uncharacterised protein [Burkholderia pseudomallei]|nr:Uncharacterised protein [Burkholderia pseudomallei]CAJ6252603.1 Uncharacterised protein [Burkholderia pseudomallei]CAJ6835641.1 Uncharacterised protein [Burkholderia pseudomallei]CAJ7516061.1 Uncharacterised protein [Burkholderia pseudomallei]CAJ8659365.1 Uncharacterised protein [Burkholderia pseudomallei]